MVDAIFVAFWLGAAGWTIWLSVRFYFDTKKINDLSKASLYLYSNTNHTILLAIRKRWAFEDRQDIIWKNYKQFSYLQRYMIYDARERRALGLFKPRPSKMHEALYNRARWKFETTKQPRLRHSGGSILVSSHQPMPYNMWRSIMDSSGFNP